MLLLCVLTRFVYPYLFVVYCLIIVGHRQIWVTIEIIPVPKKPQGKKINDLRPVALTSIVTKSSEKIISKEIKKCSGGAQDPMQFAYTEKRSVEDAIFIISAKRLQTSRHAQKLLSDPFCRLLFCFQYSLTSPHYPKKE